MSEILYRPIIKDDEHLLHSKSNPNYVKGLTRDSDNKNPNINDWEPVEVMSGREYLEHKKLLYEDGISEIQKKRSKVDAETLILNIAKFVAKNPEFLVTFVLIGKKVGQCIISDKSKLVTNIQKKKDRNNEKIKKDVNSQHKLSSKEICVKKDIEMDSCADFDSQIEYENMDIEDARELILSILLDYISMKKKLNRLSNVNINNIRGQELKIGDVVAQLDTIIKVYPKLMDESTSENILLLLKMNTDLRESEKIKEVLRIESEPLKV